MSLKTKKISELEILESTSENTNVIVEENGATKRIPKDKMIPEGVVTQEVMSEALKEVENKIPTDTVTSEQLTNVENKIPTDTVTSEQLTNVENKIPTDTVTSEQLTNVENKIPTDTVTSEQLTNVENKIPTDTVTSEQLRAVENKIPTKASDVKADPEGTATTAVTNHNVATDAHNDIRLLIEGLTTRLNTLADSDDVTLDQMSELVVYIKNNKDLIDGITTAKVSVIDIIDNLTTNVADKPLSAAQGVALKALIDALPTPNLSETDSTSKAYVEGVLQPRHLPEGYPYEEEVTVALVEDFVAENYVENEDYPTMSPGVGFGKFTELDVESEFKLVIDGVERFGKLTESPYFENDYGTFDGTVHYLGNASIIRSDFENTGEDYVLVCYERSGGMNFFVNPQTENATRKRIISVYMVETLTHPINHKFLLEGYPYEETVIAEVVQKEWDTFFEAGARYVGTGEQGSLSSLEGKDVIVYVNGEKFTTKCEYDGTVGRYLISLGDKFEIGETVTEIGTIMVSRSDTTEETTYTVKICTEEEQTTVVPMAEKFLPEDYINELINTALGVIEDGTY